MDGGDGDDVGAVFGVEVIEVGEMLEVVGVHGAVLHHVVGNHIVAVFLNVEGDVLGGENVLGNGKDLSMGMSYLLRKL